MSQTTANIAEEALDLLRATPIILARVAAVMAQHTAMAWAELLDDAIAEQGGDV